MFGGIPPSNKTLNCELQINNAPYSHTNDKSIDLYIFMKYFIIFSCESNFIPRVVTHSQTHSPVQIGAIAHNSVNFQARNSRFCMEVHLDPPHKIIKKNGRQKAKWPPRNKMAAKTKLSITWSIFKLESPDFAWYFIMTILKCFLPKKQNGRQKIN